MLANEEQERSGRDSGEPEWNYTDCGPDKWTEYYEIGRRQSPINILIGADSELIVRSTCCGMPAAAAATKTLPALRATRRIHLDSAGEDDSDGLRQERSSSTSSSDSTTNSPVQKTVQEYTGEPIDGQLIGEHHQLKVSQWRCQPSNLKTGTRQITRHCATNRKIFLGYPRYLSAIQVCNTGHNWQVDMPPELSAHTLLSGPPLGEREFRLAQFHCHWGESCSSGSEHQINGKSYAAEIHFVHWNCTEFSSMEEASKYKHGLAVLGVLVEALDGEQHRNKHLDKIISGLKQLDEAGSSSTVQARLDLKKLFPANRWSYATYDGSLTTPPLTEVVDWIVFLNPIQCSSSQIEQFRKLKCSPSGARNGCSNQTFNGSSGERLLNCCRPIQPTDDRLVSIWTHHHHHHHHDLHHHRHHKPNHH